MLQGDLSETLYEWPETASHATTPWQDEKEGGSPMALLGNCTYGLDEVAYINSECLCWCVWGGGGGGVGWVKGGGIHLW